MTLHATVIEQIWFAAAMIAALIVVVNLFDAWQNLNYIDATGQNGRRRTLALQHIRSELFRLTLCCVKAVVAGVAMTSVQPTLDASVIGWMTASVVILIWSLLDAKTRHGLRLYRNSDLAGGRRATDTQPLGKA